MAGWEGVESISQLDDEMPAVTIRRLLQNTAARLRAAGVASPELDAGLLLAHVLEFARFRLALEPEFPVDEECQRRFEALVAQRMERRPISHLLGRAEFWSLAFDVTDATLAPRPETEMMVAETIEFLRGHDGAVVVDVGTGTGCIPVALATEMPTAFFHAIDLCPDALNVARVNAAHHGVESRMEFHLSDLFSACEGRIEPAAVDVVVSNPPYVRHDEAGDVDPEVLWEPRTAVFCDGDPVGLYVEIARQAAAYVRPGGLLLLELPGDDPARVKAGITGLGTWTLVRVRDDHAEKPRMLRAIRGPA